MTNHIYGKHTPQEITFVQPPTHERVQHSEHPAVGWFRRKRNRYNAVKIPGEEWR